MAKPYRKPGSRFWWIAPFINGVQVHQSSKETDYKRAERKLKRLEGKIASHEPITAKTDRGSFQALLELVRANYKMKQRRTLSDLNWRIDKELSPALGHLPAASAWEDIEQYVEDRRRTGVTNNTINRELAIVRRAYRLGARRGLVSHIPYIEMLPGGDPREGYYTPQEFQAILRQSSELLRNILIVAFITGWRMRSIFRLEWKQVDFDEGFVWQTERKNAKATRWSLDAVIPTLGISLRQVFEEQAALAPVGDRVVPYVFHRNGKPVRAIRWLFKAACRRAGIHGRVFHDFRGTAIVNLLEAGTDPATIMNMVGLKTQGMVIHYALKRGMRDDRVREVARLLAERFPKYIKER
jgi:integrase